MGREEREQPPVLTQGAVPKQKCCKGSKHLLQFAAEDEEKSKLILLFESEGDP